MANVILAYSVLSTLSCTQVSSRSLLAQCCDLGLVVHYTQRYCVYKVITVPDTFSNSRNCPEIGLLISLSGSFHATVFFCEN
jgi:hypothetical protein